MKTNNQVTLEISGQTLDGTVLTPAKLTPGVLFIHGWGGCQEQDLARAEEIAQLGCVCFTFDLRGHARHDADRNRVTRSDGLADVTAAYDFLVSQPGVDLSAIAVVGTSYGGYLAALLTAERPVAWLALRVPALYPDSEWDVPKALLDRTEINRYRTHFRSGHQDRALAACEAFAGDVLIVESEYDDYVPHAAISSYMASFRRSRSLNYRILKGADHALQDEKQRKTYNTLLINWVEERVRESRRPS